MLLVNTEKRLEIFEKRKEELNYLATFQKLCIQPNLQQPPLFDSQWIEFERLYKKQGFIAVTKRYGN